jgi:hypothetical protein
MPECGMVMEQVYKSVVSVGRECRSTAHQLGLYSETSGVRVAQSNTVARFCRRILHPDVALERHLS